MTALSLLVTGRQRRRDEERKAKGDLNAAQINPLRRQAVEVHVRLVEILRGVEAKDERRRVLGIIADPAERVSKRPAWFTGERTWGSTTSCSRASARICGFLYYLETARGEKLDRVEQVAVATRDLASFLDRYTAGGDSVTGRLEADA